MTLKFHVQLQLIYILSRLVIIFFFNQSESKIIKLRRLAGQQISQLDRLAQNMHWLTLTTGLHNKWLK